MKKAFVILAFVFCFLFFGCVSTKSVEMQPFEEIVDVPGKMADDLFVKSNSWMVDNFKNANSVVQFSDKAAGVIKGKYIAPNIQDGMYLYDIQSTITIEVKDERYRISMADPVVYYLGTTYAPTAGNRQVYPLYDKLADKLKVEWSNLAQSLKNNLTSNSSNW